jgi:phosphohistidine phosphatase
MKTLIIVRHAKSSWADPGMIDFDRPLNERGKKDAPEMAHRLLAHQLKVDLLVSSPAKRARKTAKYFAEVLEFEQEAIVMVPELYHPHQDAILQVVKSFPDEHKVAALFSHNPGVTEFINSLTELRVDHVPTCAVFAASFPVMHWDQLELGQGKFLFFEYPKGL